MRIIKNSKNIKRIIINKNKLRVCQFDKIFTLLFTLGGPWDFTFELEIFLVDLTEMLNDSDN